MRIFVAIICSVGIQPERLNAEGDSLSAFSRGWSISVTPGMPVLKEKRLEDANVVAKVAAIRVLQAHHMGWHDTEGYASLHPRLRATRFARAFDLSGRAAAWIGCAAVRKITLVKMRLFGGCAAVYRLWMMTFGDYKRLIIV